jgi:FkbM family methyltransferase
LALLLSNVSAVRTTLQRQMLSAEEISDIRFTFHVSSLDNPVKLVSELSRGGPDAHYNLSGITTMVDVGANIGSTSIIAWKLAQRAGICLRVIAVEPVPETYLFLRWNMHANGVPEGFGPCGGIVTYNSAISSAPGNNVSINIGDRSMNAHVSGQIESKLQQDSSYVRWINKPRRNSSRVVNVKAVTSGQDDVAYTVPTTNLEQLLKTPSQQVDLVGLLKVDCEGCEVCRAFLECSTFELVHLCVRTNRSLQLRQYDLFRQLEAHPSLSQRISRVAGEMHRCYGPVTRNGKRRMWAACQSMFKFIKRQWPGQLASFEGVYPRDQL